MEWTRKDLLSLYDLSAEEITFLLDTAEEFKKVSERNVKKVPALRGKTVAPGSPLNSPNSASAPTS